MKRISTCLFALVIGIGAFAQWTPLASGFFSNRDMTIKDGTYYMVTYPGGIKATDDFVNWTDAINGIPLTSGNAFVESVGNNANFLFCGSHTGVYSSADDGANWTASNGALPFSSTIYVKKFFEFNGDMYAMMNNDIANGGGLYISPDDGINWYGTSGGMTSNTTITDVVEFEGSLYASTNIGLFVSDDWGATWVADAHFSYGVHAFWATPDAMVVSGLLGIERSTNNGGAWTIVTGPSDLSSTEMIGYGTTMHLAARGGSDAGIWISSNSGLTWAMDITGVSGADQSTTYQFYLSETVLYLGAILDSYSTPRPDVSVGEIGLFNGFNVNFNEDSQTINILVDGPVEAKTKATLFDLTGRQLETLEVREARSSFTKTGLNTGIYIVRITQGGQELPIKVVVH